MYHVYKKDIENYRVYDTMQDKIVHEGSQLFVYNPRFIVNYDGYLEAEKNNFINSGDPDDYFAWIECDNLLTKVTQEQALSHRTNIYFNPYKMFYFAKRHSMEPIIRAPSVVIRGNFLFIP